MTPRSAARLILAYVALVEGCEVHAISHITGGGLANNLVRVLPDGIAARLDRASWTPAPVFRAVQGVGGIAQPDIEATLNMGVGMAVVLPEASVDAARAALDARGVPSWVLGETRSDAGSAASVELVGNHPAQ